MLKYPAVIFFFMIYCAQAAVKDDLGSLYASAFKNNWNKVTVRTEAIIEDFEKNQDGIKTLKQLNDLEEFILANKLNKQKTEAFLSELNTVRNTIKKPEEMKEESVRPVVKPMVEVKIVPLKIHRNPESGLVFKMVVGASLITALSAVMAVFIVRRQRQLRNKRFYPFEKSLSNEDMAIWEQVKPSFKIAPELIKGTVVFSNFGLFSLEFELAGNLKKESLLEMKKIMKDISAELLLLSEWSTPDESTRKLVLNFPKAESAA